MKKVKEKLLCGLASSDWGELYPAWQKLDTDEYGTPEVRSLLWRGLLFCEDSTVREIACSNLGWLGGPSNERAILAVRAQADWSMRCVVASALSKYRTARSHRALRSMAERDPKDTVRRWAIVALYDQGMLEDPRGYFEAMLATDPEIIVKIGLWGVLLKFGAEHHQHDLEKVLSQPAPTNVERWEVAAAKAMLEMEDREP